MDFEKLGLKLFDFLGYLLPGIITLFGLSFLEMNFLNSDILSLTRLINNSIIALLLAYFIGHICHSLGTIVQNWTFSLLPKNKSRLEKDFYNQIRLRVANKYNIDLSSRENQKLNTLETYLIADQAVLTSGKATEREQFIALSGFYKGSFISLSILSLIFISTLIKGGAILILGGNNIIKFTFLQTSIVCIILVLITYLFLNRYRFFNQLKMNSTLISFLVIHEEGINQTK